MAHKYMKTMFTDTIRKAQEKKGSRENYQRMEDGPIKNDELREREVQFIKNRDSFYMATVSEKNWPYIQHRGGPKGFIKVLSPQQIAFPDFSGNRQYISVGNAQKNNRTSVIMVDYPHQSRLKLVGTLEIKDVNETFEKLFFNPEYKAPIERVILINVVGYDWNCPQHITPRYTASELEEIIDLSQGHSEPHTL